VGNFDDNTWGLSVTGGKGPGSRAAGLAMAYKLIGTAADGWRRINSPHLAALVRAGAKFEKGQHVTTNPEDQVAA